MRYLVLGADGQLGKEWLEVLNRNNYTFWAYERNDLDITDYIKLKENTEIKAFPWLNTLEMNIKKPYFLIEPKHKTEPVIDERVAFLIKDILQEFMTMVRELILKNI